MLTDGFALGHRSGVVCNSDGHKGRPGASYPGASMFGAYGGLTCFLAESLTRDGIFECLRRRHHYGTTGTRLFLDVRAELAAGGKCYHDDPNVFPDAGFDTVSWVMMGDIVQTQDAEVTLAVEVSAQGPIERIEIDLGLVRFQPSELMKLAVPMAVAWLLTRGRLPPGFTMVLAAVMVTLVPAGLVVVQPDLGTAIMLIVSGMIVVFLSGIRWRYIMMLFAALAALAPFLWLRLDGYQQQRILTLFDRSA